VLVPFSGPEKDDHDKDCYNYFLSQMEIRMEMAFGRLVLVESLEITVECSLKECYKDDILLHHFSQFLY